jgi:hypothetical protein
VSRGRLAFDRFFVGSGLRGDGFKIECNAPRRKHATSVFVCRIAWLSMSGFVGIEQKAFEALGELVAIREMTPGPCQPLIVDPQSPGGRFGSALFSIGRERQAVCNVIAEFLEHRGTPTIQAEEQTAAACAFYRAVTVHLTPSATS